MATQEKSDRWYQTVVSPCWTGHRELAFENEPFNDDVMVARWRELGYTQSRFTGDMYDMRRPEPSWMSGLRRQFAWEHFSWSVYRMGPGTVLPAHRDTYARFREVYGITDPDSIWRAVVFMEPWQSGHYFEIDGEPLTRWIPGTTVVWRNDVEHLAANVGATDRYTLQITGVIYDRAFL